MDTGSSPLISRRPPAFGRFVRVLTAQPWAGALVPLTLGPLGLPAVATQPHWPKSLLGCCLMALFEKGYTGGFKKGCLGEKRNEFGWSDGLRLGETPMQKWEPTFQFF